MRKDRSTASRKLVIQGNTAVLQDQPPVLFYDKEMIEPLVAVVAQAINFIRAGVPEVQILVEEKQYRSIDHLGKLIASCLSDLESEHADRLSARCEHRKGSSNHVFVVDRLED